MGFDKLQKEVVPAVRGWQCFDVELARSSLAENANAVAIVTGAKSGVIVVDVDLPGLEQWHEVIQKYGCFQGFAQ